jgi:hypothetical protein
MTMRSLNWTIVPRCELHALADGLIGFWYCPVHHTVHMAFPPPFLPPEKHIEEIAHEMEHEVTHAVLLFLGEVEAARKYDWADLVVRERLIVVSSDEAWDWEAW